LFDALGRLLIASVHSISVHHYDLYRLHLGDDMSALQLPEAFRNGAPCLYDLAHPLTAVTSVVAFAQACPSSSGLIASRAA
jgi:hypothetical protein